MGALSFKELVASDISDVFLNSLEFADKRLVNGKEMSVMTDDNELLERDKSKLLNANLQGTYKSRRLIYVAKSEFGPRPAHGALLTLGTNQYRISSCTEEDGILAIELEASKS